MNQQAANQLINQLYQAVDSKDLRYLADVMAEDVNFRIGNYEVITGKARALSANQAFFESIAAMRHRIDKIWTVNDDLLCRGEVEYERLDGSGHSAQFATALTLCGGKIADYLVYADLSGL